MSRLETGTTCERAYIRLSIDKVRARHGRANSSDRGLQGCPRVANRDRCDMMEEAAPAFDRLPGPKSSKRPHRPGLTASYHAMCAPTPSHTCISTSRPLTIFRIALGAPEIVTQKSPQRTHSGTNGNDRATVSVHGTGPRARGGSLSRPVGASEPLMAHPYVPRQRTAAFGFEIRGCASWLPCRDGHLRELSAVLGQSMPSRML